MLATRRSTGIRSTSFCTTYSRIAARLIVALAALPLIFGLGVAYADQVDAPLGFLPVDADTANNPLLFSSMTINPSISENIAAEWPALTTITINAPVGFGFNTAVLTNATVTPAVGALTLVSTTALPTGNSITFTVMAASVLPSSITFDSIQLRALSCATGVVGNAADITVTITPGPTSLVNAPLVDVRVVPGALDHFVLTPNLTTQVAGSPINFVLRGEDACNNPTPGPVPVGGIVISATGGAGVRTFLPTLVPCHFTITDPILVDNMANIDGGGCNEFDGAGQGVFQVTSPIGEDPLITISATAGLVTGSTMVQWITTTCSLAELTPGPNAVTTPQTVRATVLRNGTPFNGATVNFLVTVGPNAGANGTDMTDALGEADFTYAGALPGIETIQASGNIGGIPFTCTINKEWVAPQCALAPPTAVLGLGDTHTATVTLLKSPGVLAPGINVTFLVTAGPNLGATLMVPTDAFGQASFPYVGAGGAGVDTIQASGAIGTALFSCTSTAEWIDPSCTLLPATSVNAAAAGTPHTVNLHVQRRSLPAPVAGAGVTVTFTVTSGPNAGASSGPVVTNGTGDAMFTYNSSGLPGLDTITVNGSIGTEPFSCSATKEWIDPACDITPANTVGPVGTMFTATVAVLRRTGPVPVPALSQPVTFLVTSGPNAGTTLATMTDAVFGLASFPYTSNGIDGIDTIQVSGLISGVLFTCTTTREWIAPSCSLAPLTDVNVVGASHSVTVTVLRRSLPVPVPADGVSVTFLVTAGPNIGTTNTINTNAAGQATFLYVGNGGPGIDTISVTGSVAGVALVPCTATKEWIAPACSLAPSPATSILGVAHTVTSTLVRRPGVPAGGILVNFTVTAGPNAGLNGTDTTDGMGLADFTYTGPLTGTDTITATATIDGVPVICTASHTIIETGCMFVPPVASLQAGTNTDVVLLLAKNGAPAPGVTVTFQVAGVNPFGPSNLFVTNAAGQATLNYTSNGNTGVDTITASGTIDGAPFTCMTTREWINTSCTITPPSAANAVGANHLVTVQLVRNPALPAAIGPGVTVDFEITGTAGPNLTGSSATNGSGQATFNYTRALPGLDTIKATSSISGVTTICTATKEWLIVACDLSPPSATNQVGTNHSVTVTVSKNGVAVGAGVPVTFQITVGPNSALPPAIINTNASGQATFIYTSNGTPGTDTIQSSGTVQSVPFTCTATKTWNAAQCSFLTPPAETLPVGANATLTTLVALNGVAVGAGVPVTFQITSGPDAGLPIVINTLANGTATLNYTNVGGVPGIGTDTISVSGVVSGAPYSCTATKQFVQTGCALDPPAATRDLSSPHTVTVTVLSNGAPAVGVNVNFAVTAGPNLGQAGSTGMGTTNGAGQATFTYNNVGGLGLDTITASGLVLGLPFNCTATVLWVDADCSLTPPVDTNQVGTQHIVTVNVSQNGVAQGGVLVSFEITAGPNASLTGLGLTSSIVPNVGKAVFTYTSNGVLGTDTIQASGAAMGVPFLCTATKTWISAGCSITPATDTNQVGTNHAVTSLVTSNGVPVPGVLVNFLVTAGPNIGQNGSDVTNGLGIADFNYNGSLTPGVDTIEATGLVLGVPIQCTATKTWINAACTLTPPTDSNAEDTQHTVTSTVTRNGVPVAGVNVAFNVTVGPNAGLNVVNPTNASGQATFTYTGAGGPGVDTIVSSGNVDGVPFTCNATKTWLVDDDDGIPPDVEDMAPNNGDGNNDGIPDSLQPNVASLPDIFGNFMTFEVPLPFTLFGVKAIDLPSPEIAPPDVIFPRGFFEFEVRGLPQGGEVIVKIFLHSGPTGNSYYKFGPTPIIPIDRYYSFLFDGDLGAEVNGNMILLHLRDGARGDHDLDANGVIVEPGGPALEANNPAPLIAAPACGSCGAGVTVMMMPMMFLMIGFAWRGRKLRRNR